MRPYSILELKFINLAICTVCTQNQVFFPNTLYYLPTSCICWPKYLKYFSSLFHPPFTYCSSHCIQCILSLGMLSFSQAFLTAPQPGQLATGELAQL